MNKQQFFNAVRNYVNRFAVEPREGFKANCLSIEAGNFQLSIEGRNAGTGYCVVREQGEVIATDNPLDPLMQEIMNWHIVALVFSARKAEANHAHLADGVGNCTVCAEMVA